MIVYRSTDDGALYDDVDDSSRFEVYEIPDTITLKAGQLTNRPNDIIEILTGAHIARLISSPREGR